MPAEITITHGVAEAAFSNTPAWHGLGTVFDHDMTSQEAITAARLDWTVKKKPIFTLGDDGQYKPVKGFLALTREDTGDALSIVSKKYKEFQNTEAFEFLDTLNEEGTIRYESAISLSGGKLVVLLAKIPSVQDEVVEGDNLNRYLLFSNNHGGGSIKIFPTSIRVVCVNTYRIALSGAEHKLIISHRGNITEKLNKTRNAIEVCNNGFRVYTSVARTLSRVKFDMNDWNDFLDKLMPIPYGDGEAHKRTINRITSERQALTKLFTEDPKQKINGIGFTAWSALCAVNEYVDYRERRGKTVAKKNAARFNDMLWGNGDDIKRFALANLLDFAGVAEPEYSIVL